MHNMCNGDENKVEEIFQIHGYCSLGIGFKMAFRDPLDIRSALSLQNLLFELHHSIGAVGSSDCVVTSLRLFRLQYDRPDETFHY